MPDAPLPTEATPSPDPVTATSPGHVPPGEGPAGGPGTGPQRGRGPGRRALIGGAVVAAAVGGAGAWALTRGRDRFGGGGDDGEPHASCADPAALQDAAKLGAAQLVYAVEAKPRSMKFEPAFLTQLQAWWKDWNATSRYRGATAIDSYGAYVAKDGCLSWHAAGRAFDIAALRSGKNVLVNCRTDLWGDRSAAQLAELNRRYWTLGASLHLHFAYVLTHYFDDLHKNHIHIDNGISAGGMSSFDPDSRVQNQAVEAISNFIWGTEGEIKGTWSSAKKRVAPVLDQLGIGELTQQQNWQAFLRASVKQG